jgi:hypothetical protein
VKTFLLDGGDLQLGQGGFTTVEGPPKLRQDLGVSMREPYGCDRFHPRWGSLLYDFVGMNAVDEAAAYVRGEITRLIQNYIHVQGSLLAQDRASNRRPRYGRGEVISDLKSIDIQQAMAAFRVRVSLMTLSDVEVTLTQTVR